MDSVLIILLADDAKLGSTAAVFPAVSHPDTANLRMKPHVIGRQRASRLARGRVWRKLVGGISAMQNLLRY